MKKKDLAGLDYVVESYLSGRSTECNFATREYLDEWITQNETLVRDINEIGMVLMDLRSGGTTPKRFEKFRKSFEQVKESYETCEKPH